MSSGSPSSLSSECQPIADSPSLYDDWSVDEHKTFEVALAQFFSAQDRWERIAACLPSKGPQEVQAYYQLLEEDVMRIQAGQVPLPNYEQSLVRTGSGRLASQRKDPLSSKAGPSPKKSKVDTSSKDASEGGNKRKGVPWTEEEHKLFLMGLAKFGKGDWRSIARNFVQSRTPTQVASHAQKYFIRLNSSNKKDKRRASIHDITADHIMLPELQQAAGFDQPAAAQTRVAQRVC